MSGTEADRYVMLRGGLAVPIEPVLLALDLEARGVTLQREGHELIVRPSCRVTDADRAGVRRWKWHLLALVDYAATPPVL